MTSGRQTASEFSLVRSFNGTGRVNIVTVTGIKKFETSGKLSHCTVPQKRLVIDNLTTRRPRSSSSVGWKPLFNFFNVKKH